MIQGSEGDGEKDSTNTDRYTLIAEQARSALQREYGEDWAQYYGQWPQLDEVVNIVMATITNNGEALPFSPGETPSWLQPELDKAESYKRALQKLRQIQGHIVPVHNMEMVPIGWILEIVDPALNPPSSTIDT